METTSKKSITKSELINKLKSIPNSVFKEYEIEFLYLSGSWATGTNNWWSDIDIFMSIPSFQNYNPKEKILLLVEIADYITKYTGFDNIQPSVFEVLPLHIQFSAINTGILIYEENKQIRLNFIEKLLNNYYDHKIWYENLLNESLGINHGYK